MVMEPRTVPPPVGATAEEPAREIGEVFAKKIALQPYIASIVALVAMSLGRTVPDGTVEHLTMTVMLLAMVWAPVSAHLAKSRAAKAQAEATRKVVYSPNTVQKIANEAAITSDAVIAPPPGEVAR